MVLDMSGSEPQVLVVRVNGQEFKLHNYGDGFYIYAYQSDGEGRLGTVYDQQIAAN